MQWLAGFFDGEGCASITKHQRADQKSVSYYPMASIGQKNRDILVQIREFIGLGYICKHSQTSGMYQWCCSHLQAYKFLKKILPYLKLKRTQARYIIQYMENKKDERPLSTKELRWREMHRQLVSLCNRKKEEVPV